VARLDHAASDKIGRPFIVLDDENAHGRSKPFT
jgi:hypothetical protein